MAHKYSMWSTYAYVLDNPLIFVDPSGKSAVYVDGVKQTWGAGPNDNVGKYLSQSSNALGGGRIVEYREVTYDYTEEGHHQISTVERTEVYGGKTSKFDNSVDVTYWDYISTIVIDRNGEVLKAAESMLKGTATVTYFDHSGTHEVWSDKDEFVTFNMSNILAFPSDIQNYVGNIQDVLKTDPNWDPWDNNFAIEATSATGALILSVAEVDLRVAVTVDLALAIGNLWRSYGNHRGKSFTIDKSHSETEF